MCICMSLHVSHACSSLQRPEEVVGSFGTGITDNSELSVLAVQCGCLVL